MGALDELLAHYVPRVRAQVGSLADLLSAGDVDAAIAVAHKIAGAAGSYGLAELSAEARVLELALEAGEPAIDQLERVRAMSASIPEHDPPERSAKILVLGEASGADVMCTPDPHVAFEWAMDRPLLGVVVDYARGRALLRSLSSLEGIENIPILLTGVDEESAEQVRAKTGARATFPGDVDETVLARARELAS